MPRSLLLQVARAGGQRGVLHELHGIVPPGHRLLVLEGHLARLAVALRAASLKVARIGALRQVGVTLGSLG